MVRGSRLIPLAPPMHFFIMPRMNDETAPSQRRILGIDPGTRRVGWGVVEEEADSLRYVASGTVKADGDDFGARLVAIHRALQAAIEEHKPAVAAVESVFAGDNVKTAIAIGEGRGVAVLSAAEANLEVVGYEPAIVKRAVTGSGRASKEQVLQMVRVLLALPEIPATDHEADALALAITHSRRDQIAKLSLPRTAKQRGPGGMRRRRR